MTVRDSFVEYFNETNALRVEEASIGHVNDDPINHGNDDWGKDPFKYHLLNCISHQCFTRFLGYHGFTVSTEELQRWALLHGELHDYDGDIPDYIGLMAGAYGAWINWGKAGMEMPEFWRAQSKDIARWEAMTPSERTEELRKLLAQGMELLNQHTNKDPLKEGE